MWAERSQVSAPDESGPGKVSSLYTSSVEQSIGGRPSVRTGYLVGIGAWLLVIDFILVGAVGHRLPRPLGVAGSWLFIALSAALLATVGARRLARSREQATLLRLQQDALSSLGALTDPALASLSTDKLLDEMLTRLLRTLGVETATVYLFDPTRHDHQELVARASVGYWGTAIAGHQLPAGGGMAARILQTRQAVTSDHAAEIGELMPGVPAVTAVAGCPIVVEDRLIGICAVASTASKSYSEADIQLLQLVADRVGAGIERSRLDEAERRSRLAAERARRQVTLLARASEALSEAIDDYEATLASLVDVAVPDFADWCAVDVVKDGGGGRRVAIRHLGRSGADLSAQLGAWLPGLREMSERAVQTGRTQQVPARSEPVWAPESGPLTSCVIVPIRVRGRTFGLLTFALDPGHEPYQLSDVAAAEEVAGRTAITVERVLLYLELRGREARWRALVEATPAAIVEVDLHGRVLVSNRFAAGLFGWEEQQPGSGPGGSGSRAEFAPDTARAFRDLWARAAEGEEIVDTEVSVTTRGSDQRDLAVSVAPLGADSGGLPGILMLAADVTERRRLQEGLREAQQMEALGQVAGGVAHDLNNLLTVISGYTDLLTRRLALEGDDRQLFDNIQGAADRASVLIGQLLTISRRQVAKPVVMSPHATLRAMSDVLQRILGVDIALRWDLDEGAGNIRIDPGHFEQLLLNLALNARDAMPDGGTLTIATTGVSCAGASSPHRGAQPGRLVRMTVADTGVGMDEVTRRRCFEPFFTTKDRSKGTGLGLAAALGVVEEGGGTIQVDSEPGRGSTFTVLLPAVDAEPLAAPTSAPQGRDLQGIERVLVVDDDADVRQLVRKVLDHEGYQVLEADSGPTAIDAAASWDGPIDLLLTDIVMPGMRGPDVAAAVKASRPSIEVLFMSAFTDGTVLPAEIGADPLALLAKPFLPSELLERVRAILDRRSR